jgi:hypothetical protein
MQSKVGPEAVLPGSSGARAGRTPAPPPPRSDCAAAGLRWCGLGRLSVGRGQSLLDASAARHSRRSGAGMAWGCGRRPKPAFASTAKRPGMACASGREVTAAVCRHLGCGPDGSAGRRCWWLPAACGSLAFCADSEGQMQSSSKRFTRPVGEAY